MEILSKSKTTLFFSYIMWWSQAQCAIICILYFFAIADQKKVLKFAIRPHFEAVNYHAAVEPNYSTKTISFFPNENVSETC